jgi:hypothetical protein
MGSIGRISTNTPRLTNQICAARRILDILTPIFPPRCVHNRLSEFDVNHAFQPLAPANGAPPDATKDPLLKHKIHGAEILDVRKALAFAGFTHKSPPTIEYTRAEKVFDTGLEDTPKLGKGTTVRGRPLVRETRDIGLGRAISM